MSVTTIDSESLGHEGHTATYLVREGDRALFVETNTNHAVERMLSTLRDADLEPTSVDYIIITHVHLDHAGGASQLMEACPNATLLAHPRAAPHMVDPSRIIAGSKKVYGDEPFTRFFGDITPIPEARVRIMNDRERLTFGERELVFFYTRGHANHHFVVHDSKTDGIFTGDAFGIAYPELQANGLCAFPSTTPTDFDADEALRSLDLMLSLEPERVYLTHFGSHENPVALADALRPQLKAYGALVDELYASDENDEALDDIADERVRAVFDKLLRQHGIDGDAQIREFLEMDVAINGQGIAFAAKKKRFKEKVAKSAKTNDHGYRPVVPSRPESLKL